MKFIFDLLAAVSLKRIWSLIYSLIQGYLVRHYLNFVLQVRSIVVLGIITTLCICLMVAGFFIVHIALFMSLPLSETNKIIFMFVLGGTYIILPLLALWRLHSRMSWLSRTGAKKILEDLSKS